MHITEQWILSHAPNPALAENGRELSESGRYAALCRTEDGRTCWAECAGSARNPYYVSLDCSLSEDAPVCSCSCPSRQSPCKHVIGLMYELLSGKEFAVDEPPPYVAKARARQAAAIARSEARLERTRKQNAAAREKRLERQLEGLAKAERFSAGLLRGGLKSLSGLPAQSLERLATELGNRDLPGARDAFEHIALIDRALKRDEADKRAGYAEIARTLAALQAMILRSRALLGRQLSASGYAMEEPVLYEMLGGVWDPDELREIGSQRKNARLVQLSFDVSRPPARRTRAERGFWADLTRGDIVHTLSTRPSRMPKGVGTDDTCFSLLEAPLLYEAPVVPCPCVWWDSAVPKPLGEGDLSALRGMAAARVSEVVKSAAAQLGGPLLPAYVPALVRAGAVGYAGRTLVLADGEGGRIALRDRREDGAERASVCRLTALPRPPEEGDAVFGLIFYDEADRRYCLHPYSVVRADGIVRLQF